MTAPTPVARPTKSEVLRKTNSGDGFHRSRSSENRLEAGLGVLGFRRGSLMVSLLLIDQVSPGGRISSDRPISYAANEWPVGEATRNCIKISLFHNGSQVG